MQDKHFQLYNGPSNFTQKNMKTYHQALAEI